MEYIPYIVSTERIRINIIPKIVLLGFVLFVSLVSIVFIFYLTKVQKHFDNKKYPTKSGI